MERLGKIGFFVLLLVALIDANSTKHVKRASGWYVVPGPSVQQQPPECPTVMGCTDIASAAGAMDGCDDPTMDSSGWTCNIPAANNRPRCYWPLPQVGQNCRTVNGRLPCLCV